MKKLSTEKHTTPKKPSRLRTGKIGAAGETSSTSKKPFTGNALGNFSFLEKVDLKRNMPSEKVKTAGPTAPKSSLSVGKLPENGQKSTLTQTSTLKFSKSQRTTKKQSFPSASPAQSLNAPDQKRLRQESPCLITLQANFNLLQKNQLKLRFVIGNTSKFASYFLFIIEFI